MAFILESDYNVLITTEQLGQITEESSIIDTCLDQSYEEVKEYLRHRFNVDFDMRSFTIPPDPNSVTATKDDRVFYQSALKFFICIQDAVDIALTNTDYFEEKDDRNQKLVQITTDVFLYHLHTRLNPRNIPEHRKERYDGNGDITNAMSAIKWLLMVQKGTIKPNLTPIVDENGDQPESGQSILWGSSPNNYYQNPNRNNDLTG